MAHRTLPVLSPPDFHNPAFERSFTRIVSSIDRMVIRALQNSEVSLCSYETPETSWGACDSEPCGDPATVHHLGNDLPYCGRHFRLVARQEAVREVIRG